MGNCNRCGGTGHYADVRSYERAGQPVEWEEIEVSCEDCMGTGNISEPPDEPYYEPEEEED